MIVDTTSIRQTRVPASSTLSAWQEHAWTDGIAIDQLTALDRLIVETRHSSYEIIATDGASADVLVRGGSFFPEFTRARLAGSSLGGSFLKLRSVHLGFCIEFAVDNRVIVTSPVRSIALAPGDAQPGLM
jgi:hypothetical protein